MSNTNNAAFGEVTWDSDLNFGNNKSSDKKDEFLRLKDGDNEMRLVTNPFQYQCHKGVKRVGGQGFGSKVPCSFPLHGECPLCAAGHKSSTRWYVGVIDRETKTYKILDIPYTVYNQIRNLHRNTKVWGDPKKYDINIIVNKRNPQGYHTVQPQPHTPLTADEQRLRDGVDLEALKRRTEPMVPETVQKILDKILEGGELFIPPTKNAEKNGKSTAATTKTTSSVETSDSDDDIDAMFPAHGA